MEAKTATPLGLASGQRAGRFGAAGAALPWGGQRDGAKARPTKIAQGHADPCEGQSALTDPVRPALRMWRSGHCGRLRLSADAGSVSAGASRRLSGDASIRGDEGLHVHGRRHGVTWEKGIDADARAIWGPMLALAASSH